LSAGRPQLADGVGAELIRLDTWPSAGHPAVGCEDARVSSPRPHRAPRVSAAMREGEQVTPLELFFDLVSCSRSRNAPR
jgi:hypothetical protein